jgi:hypothetical protein
MVVRENGRSFAVKRFIVRFVDDISLHQNEKARNSVKHTPLLALKSDSFSFLIIG